jgi:hypothetical protein
MKKEKEIKSKSLKKAIVKFIFFLKKKKKVICSLTWPVGTCSSLRNEGVPTH